MHKIVLASLTAVAIAWGGNFTLSSLDLGGQLTKTEEFNGFGCNGRNISPALNWRDTPAQTKSFAITVFDPDAPTGSGWWHWIVTDIPADVTRLRSGASGKKMPKGAVEIQNDYGIAAFGGPCPPKGDKAHRYIFTVYALDVPSLGLKSNTNAPVAGFMINAHTIQKASIVSYYGR